MVSVQLQGPSWFFGADASLMAFAAVIAFCVAVASLRVYKATRSETHRYFTISFVLLTLSFLVRAVTDTLLEGTIITILDSVKGAVFFFGYTAHILISLVAYLMLVIITHKVTDKRLIVLLFLILIPSLLVSGSYFLSFYGLSTLFLAFVAFAYYQNCCKVKSMASCLVFVAFLLLALSQVQFLLEVVHDYWYVGAHITQAAGYFCLLIALIRTKMK